MMFSDSAPSLRQPAAIGEWKKVDFDQATMAISNVEMRESQPATGRSYFDKVFSQNNEYKVPYPFNQLLIRLSEYTGQKINAADSSGLKVAIFPMGRSLQKNAAVSDLDQSTSLDPYFRYPRITVAVDEEPSVENALLLNLKNKMYIGFNEKAQALEVISYNEELGRYEFQVVQDYAEGKLPTVKYANRSLCLSCHQNQAPIFSRGPWSESNANPQVSEKLIEVLDRSFGKPNCSPGKNQTYCHQAENAFYFGAPLRIETNVTQKFDESTDVANLSYAYQKMWKELCLTSECRMEMLRSMILYRLTDQQGLKLSKESHNENILFERAWQQRFPWGLSISNPNIPDRDPLKDVTSNPNTSNDLTVSDQNKAILHSQFEPLMPRSPMDIWKDTGLDSTNTNRMVRGLSQEFTAGDLKLIDQWLKTNRSEKDLVAVLSATCQFDKDKNNLVISCTGQSDESFGFDTYVTMSGSRGQAVVSSMNVNSATLDNFYKGNSGLRFSDLVGTYLKASENRSNLLLQYKNGLGLKTISGYDLSEVTFDLDAKVAMIKVYSQSSFLKEWIKRNTDQIFKDKAFNRFRIMKAMASEAQTRLTNRQPEIGDHLPINLDPSVRLESLREQMEGFALIKNVCAQCHQNNSQVPPNFMGTLTNPLSDSDQCRRIEKCAARMLYKLKMRNCEMGLLKNKMNPMPPATFFEDSSAMAKWNIIHNPKILKFLKTLINERDLAIELSVNGIDEAIADRTANEVIQSDCPNVSPINYDQLPKCEFDKLKPMTRCH